MRIIKNETIMLAEAFISLGCIFCRNSLQPSTYKMWLVLLVISTTIRCSSSDDFLSKFNQHSYKMKDLYVGLDWYDTNYFNDFKIITFKYNRSTPAVNITIHFKIDVGDKLEGVVQAYKFASNEFRAFPIRFQANLKKGVDYNAIGLQNIYDCGNISAVYFLKDIIYHTCNFFVDESKYPPLIPTGKYKATIQGMFENKHIATLFGFAESYIPVQIPTKKHA